MIEDLHKPVEEYKSYLKDAHARNTAALFEELVKKSSVDEATNIQTNIEIRTLETKIFNGNSYGKKWRTFRLIAFALLIASAYFVSDQYSIWWIMGPIVVFAPVIYKISRIIAEANTRVEQLEKERNAKLDEAWAQMASLNNLYDWDAVSKLVQQTMPRIELDPYFTNGRLAELHNIFGLNDEFNHDDRSIIFSHSGVINGNPFVLARTLEHSMGWQTYHGSLNISWTEWETDSDGHSTTVTKHETLHASVTKPYPNYCNDTFIIFGNEAAPDLSFSRQPSNLSKLDDGFFDNFRKKRAVKLLEKKTRDLENNFTIMSNREFDSLFGATDRNHEVQFRLLFTPLAQQEMLNLLKDKEVGFGDSFEFEKKQMINMVTPSHMKLIDISGNPELFHSYDITSARIFFNVYHHYLFKSLFFGIAPILAIPLYQQHRSHVDIYKDSDSSKSCFWEHEAIANYFGGESFEHPSCITKSILKTQSKTRSDGTQEVRVTASGFRGESRTDFVSVRGGDGHSHKVSVDWTEYLNVQNESKILLKEKTSSEMNNAFSENSAADWGRLLERKGVGAQDVVLRRSILSALLPNN